MKDNSALRETDTVSEDIAYTINHALVCTATDFIDPVVGKWTQDHLGRRFSIGCGQDHTHHHDHGHGCSHHHHARASLWNLSIAELTGDFAAVPVTVMTQRTMPGLMRTIEKTSEPLIGGMFRLGIGWGNRSWAKKHGLNENSQAVKEHAQELYRYEMHHVPQAFLWTASSISINLAMQRVMGSTAPLSHMLAGKAAGAGISTALVLGARTMAPHAAKDWDGYTQEQIFTPASKKVGAWFGVKENAVEQMLQKQDTVYKGKTKWQERENERECQLMLRERNGRGHPR